MDIRRLKEKASRLTAEGRWERAEVLYRQMLTIHPRDANLWLRHAEQLKRLHRYQASVTSYRMAAQLLLADGHGARAIACVKLALELQPDDIDLVTDVIRYELHQRRQVREAHAALPFREPSDELREPLLALPMRASSPSQIMASMQDVQDALPAPVPSAPRIPLEVESPLRRWPQVRRISDTTVAIRSSPTTAWVVVKAEGAVEVRFFDALEVNEEALWLEAPED